MVPNVDIAIDGHQTLDQYNADDDCIPGVTGSCFLDRTNSSITGIVNRRLGPVSTIVARTGDSTPEGFAQFSTLDISQDITQSGRVAFTASLNTPERSSLGKVEFYAADETVLRKLVREGDPYPGGMGPSGIEIIEPLDEDFVSGYNDSGQSLLRKTTFVIRGEPDGSTTRIVQSQQMSPDGTVQFRADTDTGRWRGVQRDG